MSWMEKELKKRAKSAQSAQVPERAESGAVQMADLWRRIEGANDALPKELQLKAAAKPSDKSLPGVPPFIAWLSAPNGAGLGFNGEAIRYAWPQRSHGLSHNFWIRWSADNAFALSQRSAVPTPVPKMVERSVSPVRADYIVKCMVTGKRVRPAFIRQRRFWFF